MKVIDVQRKGRVLTKARFGCLRDTYTINITKGCQFMCVYCYARGYPGAPESGEVYLYQNLHNKLLAELDNPRRRKGVPQVVFNTATDSFQSHPGILDVSYLTMKILLERGIGLSFLTKGWIPERFIELFSEHPALVLPRIGLVSLSPQYQERFEPHAATPGMRLRNIERLTNAGLDVAVRIDPIIPFYTDDETSVKNLYEALASRKVTSVSLSYLHLRPAIRDQLRRELPTTEAKVLQGCFERVPWSRIGTSSRSKILPVMLRKRGYERFIRLGESFGIKPLICSYKNPDMPGHHCATRLEPKETRIYRREAKRQLDLFSR